MKDSFKSLAILFISPFLFANQDLLKKEFVKPNSIPHPSSNPYSKAKWELGKKLFFDKRLSGNHQMSCATCHNPEQGWTEDRPTAIGHGGKKLGRKTPTILNGAWGWSFFWDGRANTLEEQALGPIQSPDEMNLPLKELVLRISKASEYPPLFKEVFPEEGITTETIAKAIATFEREVISNEAPFDRWIAGDEKAISPVAKRGFVLFNSKAQCVNCHSGWQFTNGSFADTGVTQTDQGRGKIQPHPYLDYAFKTPTIRNVGRRHSFMHNGSVPTLKAVIEHYNKGGKFKRTSTGLFIQPLHLTQTEKNELLEFLMTLTSDPIADRSLTSIDRGKKP